MQDCYVGDIGDFGKYGLLRWLCGMRDDDGPLSLGVLWYHFECCDGGGAIDYLKSSNRVRYACCDRQLFSTMRSIVCNNERAIATIEASNVLKLKFETKFFSDKMIFANKNGREAKEKARKTWVSAGLRAVQDADLVFVDPNTGLRNPAADKGKSRSEKHAYYDEMMELWQRGQSLVVYQHVRGSVDKMIAKRRREFRKYGAPEPIVLWWHRGTARLYFILPASAHVKRLRARTCDLLDSEWGKHSHFTLVR